jgi:hypothetical protein
MPAVGGGRKCCGVNRSILVLPLVGPSPSQRFKVSGKRLSVDGIVTLGGEQVAVTGKHLDVALNDWQRVDLEDPLLGLGL